MAIPLPGILVPPPIVDPLTAPINIPLGPLSALIPPDDKPGFNVSTFKTNLSSINGPLKPSLYRVLFNGAGLNPSFEYLTERVELPDVSLDSEKIRRYGYGPLEDVPYRPVFQPLRVTIIAPANDKIGIVELVNKLSGVAPFNNPYTMSNADNTADTALYISTAGGKFSKSASPYEVAYKDDIVFDTQVSLFDVNGTKDGAKGGKGDRAPLITYNFNDCFLRSMSPIDLSWGATDQYVKVDMTIGYTDFYLT